jgi:hypothetical protein
MPLVAQGGVAGRAAVLAAPTTRGALIVMELKAALEEGIVHHLGLSPGSPRTTVLETLEKIGSLDASQMETLKRLLREMDRAEASIAAAQPVKVRPHRVQSMNRQVKGILEQLEFGST